MTDQRWQRTQALFQAAVERPVAERAAFIAAAAADDEELRREVEALLASDVIDRAVLVAGCGGGVTGRAIFGSAVKGPSKVLLVLTRTNDECEPRLVERNGGTRMRWCLGAGRP